MNLKDLYNQKIGPQLMIDLKIKNRLAVPKITKVVISTGLGEAVLDKSHIEKAAADLISITGQKPLVTKAKKSVASFKLRIGMPIGLKVTLRGDRMYHFLEKLFILVLPRMRDFRGLDPQKFDGRGNYSLGFKEQILFPEIDYAKIDRLRGLEITVVTSAKDNQSAQLLLSQMGMPFKK